MHLTPKKSLPWTKDSLSSCNEIKLKKSSHDTDNYNGKSYSTATHTNSKIYKATPFHWAFVQLFVFINE